MGLKSWLESLLRLVWKRPQRSEYDLLREALEIKPTSEMLADDALTQEQARVIYRNSLADSGVVVDGCLERLVEDTFGPLGRTVFLRFKGAPVLSAEEKRQLGLNVRAKYWHRFIECFDLQALGGTDPKSLVELCFFRAWDAAYRQKSIRVARRFDCQFVTVDSMGECRCYEKKRFHVDELPPFPNEDCPLDRCMCLIHPVLPLLEDLSDD